MCMLRRHRTRAPTRFRGPINRQYLHLFRLAATADRAAPPTAGVIHDLPDGRGATAALRRAAQATIHLAGGPWSGLDIQGGPHVGVTEYIAGTNNHGSPETSEVCWTAIDTDLPGGRQRKNSELVRIPILHLRSFNSRLTLSGAALGSLTLRSRPARQPHLTQPPQLGSRITLSRCLGQCLHNPVNHLLD
jgi:hypothetical protein